MVGSNAIEDEFLLLEEAIVFEDNVSKSAIVSPVSLNFYAMQVSQAHKRIFSLQSGVAV